MRYVRVLWRDAAYYRDLDVDDEAPPLDMMTVGMVVEDTDDYLAIAHEACEDGSYRSVTSIPRPWIKEVGVLQPPPTDPWGE